MSFLRRFTASYHRRPEKVRLVMTAVLGAAIGYITYEIIYFFNPFPHRAPTSWLLAFMIGVLRQHALHRWLTFTVQPPYWHSLGRAYVMYLGSAITTTALNGLLTGVLGINHRLAWLACILTTALISLLFLKRYVFHVPHDGAAYQGRS